MPHADATSTPGAANRAERRRGEPWWRMMAGWLLALLTALVGGFALRLGQHTMSRTYAALAARGVPVTMTVNGCRYDSPGNQDWRCNVTVQYQGRTLTFTYQLPDSRQFRPYTPGVHVPALLDPRHLGEQVTVYTVYDVKRRTGAGPLSWNTLFGTGCEIGAVAYSVLLWRRRPNTR